MSVSPLTINIMLACYTNPEPATAFDEKVWTSPSSQKSRQWLVENGLILQGCSLTEKGRAWVEFICATPVPVQEWRLPERDAA